MINKKPLTFICVQPCIPYYAWQIEVMLNNFVEIGIAENFNIQLLFAYNISEKDWRENVAVIKKVENKYGHIAQFFYYQDTRQFPITYISAIRPNVLKQHYSAHHMDMTYAVFYHDCDIVFTKFPDFLISKILDKKWYVSDTESYIGYDYIVSKGEGLFEHMCNIVGINPDIVKYNQKNSGGAQYLMKGVDYYFFDKMEKDCERMFSEITKKNIEIKAQNPSYHELQIWTADMWAILWNAWLRGFETEIIPELDFCWATDVIENWDKKYIFHNAGVTEERKNELFYKGDFRQNHPYLHQCDTYDAKLAAYKYFELIKSVSSKSCLL